MSRSSAVTVRVPATSANLGAGFDTLGLALELYDTVTVRIGRRGGDVANVRGEGADTLPRDGSHLIISTLRRGLAACGVDAPALRLSARNRIPQARGLGSSAAAVVAALAAEQVLAGARRLDRAALIDAAARIEGHADNVAACVLGGLTIAWHQSDAARATSLRCARGVAAIALVPQARSATARTRKLLPADVSHADAAFTAAHSALTVAALTRSPELLPSALDDRIHEPYRRRAMRPSCDLVDRLRDAGFAAAISGGGSSVIVLHNEKSHTSIRREVARLAGDAFHMIPLAISTSGVTATAHA